MHAMQAQVVVKSKLVVEILCVCNQFETPAVYI
jgi:hypothetical protein